MTTEDFGNNYYSFFETLSKSGLHSILTKNGWTTEHQDKERIELYNEWSNLSIYEWDNIVQLNGRLNQGLQSYNKLTKIFEDEGTRFQAELYDDNGNKTPLAEHDVHKGRLR